ETTSRRVVTRGLLLTTHLSIEIHRFPAVASAQLRQDFIHVIIEEANGAVGEQPVAAARMKAPEMDLVTEVVIVAGLEANLGRRTWIGDACSNNRDGVVLDIGGIAILARAQADTAHAAPVVAGPGKPPATVHVLAGWALT